MNLANRKRVAAIQKRIKRIVDDRKVSIGAVASKAGVDNGTVRAVYEQEGHSKQTISERTASRLERGLDEMEKSMGMVKTCVRCGRELPFGKFNSNAANKDGLQSYCIECNKEYKREKSSSKGKEKVKKDMNNNTENAITAETVRRVKEEDKPEVESKFMAPYFNITPKQLDEVRSGAWDKLLYMPKKPKKADSVLEAVESLRDEVSQMRAELRAVMVELGIEVGQ